MTKIEPAIPSWKRLLRAFTLPIVTIVALAITGCASKTPQPMSQFEIAKTVYEACTRVYTDCSQQREQLMVQVELKKLAIADDQASAQRHAANIAQQRKNMAMMNYWFSGGPTVGTTGGW